MVSPLPTPPPRSRLAGIILDENFWTITWRLFVLALILLGAFFVGRVIYQGPPPNGGGGIPLQQSDYMRGLITILFLVGTLILVVIVVLAALFASNDESTVRRVAQAREVVAPLFGILGTIVGFYFGTTTREAPRPPPAVRADGSGTRTPGISTDEPAASRTLTSAKKRAYTIRTAAEDTALDEVDPELKAAAAGGDDYTGKARKAAKLSIADAPVEVFADLKDLMDTLPVEAAMKKLKPPITTGPDSGRVKEEERNVRVRAFLYAASRENDNDYHLIVGRASDRPEQYMTVEVSGLPPKKHPSFARLKSARDKFKAFFGDNLPGTRYDFYDPPIPVEVEGSLFFDMSHITGTRPGPKSLRSRMPAIWEIHPVTDIVFEP